MNEIEHKYYAVTYETRLYNIAAGKRYDILEATQKTFVIKDDHGTPLWFSFKSPFGWRIGRCAVYAPLTLEQYKRMHPPIMLDDEGRPYNPDAAERWQKLRKDVETLCCDRLGHAREGALLKEIGRITLKYLNGEKST